MGKFSRSNSGSGPRHSWWVLLGERRGTGEDKRWGFLPSSVWLSGAWRNPRNSELSHRLQTDHWASPACNLLGPERAVTTATAEPKRKLASLSVSQGGRLEGNSGQAV